MDCHLNWKNHACINFETFKKAIQGRGNGILLKLRNFVSAQILLQVYYTKIYSFLTYSILTWGNNYITNIKPLITLQKKAVGLLVHLLKFSDYRAHTSRNI
jgi:hypothetical protein